LTRGDGLTLARETFGDLSDDAEAFRFLAKTLAKSIASVHAFDMIHRDVKPANIILSKTRKRALLCDVGACADVQTGRNMDGAEAIFDPTYGASEQFRKVASSPPLGGFPSISGLFGGKKKSEANSVKDFTFEASGEPPTDLLDAYSLGVTLLRCGVPSLRGEDAIERARRDIDACGGDLVLWRREVCASAVNDFALLDESGAWTTITRLAAVDPSKRFSVRQALDTDEFLSSA
jgi:serine/threonine protein kinase